MKCPFCGAEDTQVKDSRAGEDGAHIRRRRSCPKCNSRFTTMEYVQMRDLTVVKKDGRRVPFDREKLMRSVLVALRKRNIAPGRIEQMVGRIVLDLEARGENEVRTEEVGALAMERLLELDTVAYIRYASVYRNFTKTEDFKDFVATLLRKHDAKKHP